MSDIPPDGTGNVTPTVLDDPTPLPVPAPEPGTDGDSGQSTAETPEQGPVAPPPIGVGGEDL